VSWTVNTIPGEGDPESETWETGTEGIGAAKVWFTITANLERALVFLSVSSASRDHYGGDRTGANLYSDSVVALDAQTGKAVWHFQTVHHDLGITIWPRLRCSSTSGATDAAYRPLSC
jgi:quinoprotein glucose dehydrogenase